VCVGVCVCVCVLYAGGSVEFLWKIYIWQCVSECVCRCVCERVCVSERRADKHTGMYCV